MSINVSASSRRGGGDDGGIAAITALACLAARAAKLDPRHLEALWKWDVTDNDVTVSGLLFPFSEVAIFKQQYLSNSSDNLKAD